MLHCVIVKVILFGYKRSLLSGGGYGEHVYGVCFDLVENADERQDWMRYFLKLGMQCGKDMTM